MSEVPLKSRTSPPRPSECRRAEVRVAFGLNKDRTLIELGAVLTFNEITEHTKRLWLNVRTLKRADSVGQGNLAH